MVREIEDLRIPFSNGEVETQEHSSQARAKKVIPGPLIVAKHSSDQRTIDPIVISGSTKVGANKTFRLISDGSFRYRLSVGASAAVSTDVYVPKDTAIVIAMRDFDHINCTAPTGGTFIQAVEVK